MLGSAEEWFYRRLGGMDIDLWRNAPAERLTVRPVALRGVDWVHCVFDSALGKVQSNWKRDGEVVRYTVTVPTLSTVVLPEGATAQNGLHALRSSGGQAVFQVEAGTWQFILQQR
jgi:alpha-L-rhamnosidase